MFILESRVKTCLQVNRHWDAGKIDSSLIFLKLSGCISNFRDTGVYRDMITIFFCLGEGG